jgi:hypothetical protein
MACKIKTSGRTPYSNDGCADKNVFAINTHLNGNKSGDPIADIAYHKALSNYVLNCGEGAGSFDNIMKLYPMDKVSVNAKEYWQQNMSVVNFNIIAANTITGGVAGNVTLLIAGQSHINNGAGSFINAGYSLVNQRNGQMYEVVGTPNKSVLYNHTAVIRSYANEAVDLRKGDPLGVFQARLIGDVACSTVPSITLRDYGYMTKTNPVRFEASWCLNQGIELQNEVFQLAMIDNDGNEYQEWDPVVRHNARREMSIARTLYFLFGTKITNPNITVVGDFKGWNGYLYSMKYSGGNYVPVPLSGITKVHFDMVEEQAVKFGIREFTWYLPWVQRNNLNNNLNALFANAAGSCTFETFERSGTMDDMNGTAVLRKGVKSINLTGITHHFMTADWAQETNGLGNGILKDAIFVIPSVGSKDIKGNEVPTFESLQLEGPGSENYRYYETYDNLRLRTPFCEQSQGVIRDAMWIKINCLTNHWQFQPSSGC